MKTGMNEGMSCGSTSTSLQAFLLYHRSTEPKSLISSWVIHSEHGLAPFYNLMVMKIVSRE